MRYTIEQKKEVVRLKEEGKSVNDIVKQTGVSKTIVYRELTKAGLTNPKYNPTQNKINDNRNDNQNVRVDEASFKGVNVNYTRTGAITIESSGVVEKPILMAPEGRENPVKPGAGQQYQTAHVTEKPDIDAKENVLDTFFTRSNVEILVPVGLLVAGFLMSGKKGSKDGFREDKNGGEW